MDTVAPVAGTLGDLAVLVVNFGSHQLLRANLAPVELPDHVRVVVVDNFSTARERTAVRQLCAEQAWELIEADTNLGFGAAVNAAAQRAEALGADGLLLLNPDARIEPAVLTALRENLVRVPDAAVTPRIVTPSGRVEFRGSQVSLSTGRIRSIGPSFGDNGAIARIDGQVAGQLSGPVQGWLSGACLAIGLDLWRRSGGMSSDYFLYWEDVDLSRRVEQAGGRLMVRSDLSVVHDEGGTHGPAGRRPRSDLYYYWNCRNRLAFAAANLSRTAALRWLLHTPAESWQIVLRGGRRQLLSSPRPLLAAARGSVAGAALVVRSLLRRRPVTPTARPVLVAHPGAELYGSDRMVLETVDGLRGGDRPVTAVLPGDGPLAAELRSRGCDVVFCRMPVLRKSALRPRGFLRLLADAAIGLPRAVRLVLRCGGGGVYVNTVTIPSWLILSRLLGRRVVCHVHEAERSASPLLRRLLALPVLCADRVVVNSRFSLDVLAESLPRLRTRSTIVYNGVGGPAVPTPARATLEGALRILYLGRLSPRKGPDVALAAVAELVHRGVDVHLDLLGDVFTGYEWFAEQLQHTASGLPGRVSFLGFEPDVWPRLAAADIVVIPSVVDEPFGNTAVEAILAARPTVVSATSGLREAAGGFASAVMVAPNDALALADAVAAIAADWPEYVRRAGADALSAAERYSPARYRAEVAAAVVGGVSA